MHHLMSYSPKTNKNADRLLGFLAFWAASRPQSQADAADQFVEDLLWDLHTLSVAKDKTVRLRACQMLALILHRLPAECELSEELVEGLQEALLERLRDKQAPVRVQAISALCRLADPGEDGDFAEDAITEGLIGLLNSEKNKDVRIAVISSLPVSAAALETTIARTRDTSDDVRRVAYSVLAANFSLSMFSTQQAAQVLMEGLRDRAPRPQAAARKLLQAWLKSGCDGDAVQLLQRLGTLENEAVGEAAITTLMDMGLLSAAVLTKDVPAAQWGLRTPSRLTPEQALLWRIVTQGLQSEGTARGRSAATSTGAAATVDAAIAADNLQMLEAVMPPTVAEFMSMVSEYAGTNSSQDDFTTRELLVTAVACLDFTDASGRDAATDALQQLLQQACRRAEGRALTSGAPGECHWLPVLQIFAQLLLQLLSAPIGSALPHGHARALQLFQDMLVSHSGPDASVWEETVACAALCALLRVPGRDAAHRQPKEDDLLLLLPLQLLHAAASQDCPSVACTALKGLADLLLIWGPATLDTLRTGLLDRPPPWWQSMPAAHGDTANQDAPPQPLLQLFLDKLTDPLARQAARRRRQSQTAGPEAGEAEAAAIAAEGLAKLLMLHACTGSQARAPLLEPADAVQILAALLSAHFHPAAGSTVPAMGQCLGVFLPALSAAGASGRSLIASAAIPAARRAIAQAPANTPAAQAPGPRLLRYVAQLLQESGDSGAGDGRQWGQCQLVEACLKEALTCPSGTGPRAYAAALLKVALAVHIPQDAAPEHITTLRALAGMVAASSAGATVVQDAQALEARLQEVASASDQDCLSEEQLASLEDAVQRLRLADDAAYPASSSGTQRSVSTPARTQHSSARSSAQLAAQSVASRRQQPRSVRKTQVSYQEASSSSSEDESEEGSEASSS
ncbi:hypothetical protein WJX73_006201 [Symbiochloris irregularis]|uniref:Nuclear condensin complex subunit 3 C-terminal domain-containing protein n=1 Tax=Symbiochloris irregularis TaxID=706552 RepID=A0AAW1PYR5_9CHLO